MSPPDPRWTQPEQREPRLQEPLWFWYWLLSHKGQSWGGCMIGYLALKGAGVVLMLCIVLFFSNPLFPSTIAS